jgi:hypothetical protein
MHRLLQVISLSLIVACSGCIAGGDGLLTIQGKLSAPGAPGDCSLQLASAEEPQARSYNTRSIKQEFFEDFTVAPKQGDYRLRIACLNYKPVERTVRSTGSVTKVDLGTVVLNR